MTDLTEAERDLIRKAKELEAQRIEIYAQAVEANIADLMPDSWSNFDQEMDNPVEVHLVLGFSEKDADIFDERELRNLVRVIGAAVDRKRAEQRYLDDREDDE